MFGFVLQRVSQPTADSVPRLTVDDQKIIEESRRQLSYQAEPYRSQQYGAKLLSALDELGVRPFTTVSVNRYKALVRLRGFPSLYLSLATVGLGVLLWSVVTSRVYPSAAFPAGVLLITSLGALLVSLSSTQWHRRHLANVPETIVVPTFALQTALAIQAKVPSVSVLVEWFGPAEARDLDPFLIVQYGNVEAYVEVWDEPTFHATRRV